MSIKQFVSDHITGLTVSADGLSIATIVATLFGHLPQVAALFSLVWSVIRICETRTVRGWVARLRGRTGR